jgi:hypothetical protein
MISSTSITSTIGVTLMSELKVDTRFANAIGSFNGASRSS